VALGLGSGCQFPKAVASNRGNGRVGSNPSALADAIQTCRHDFYWAIENLTLHCQNLSLGQLPTQRGTLMCPRLTWQARHGAAPSRFPRPLSPNNRRRRRRRPPPCMTTTEAASPWPLFVLAVFFF